MSPPPDPRRTTSSRASGSRSRSPPTGRATTRWMLLVPMSMATPGRWMIEPCHGRPLRRRQAPVISARHVGRPLSTPRRIAAIFSKALPFAVVAEPAVADYEGGLHRLVEVAGRHRHVPVRRRRGRGRPGVRVEVDPRRRSMRRPGSPRRGRGARPATGCRGPPARPRPRPTRSRTRRRSRRSRRRARVPAPRRTAPRWSPTQWTAPKMAIPSGSPQLSDAGSVTGRSGHAPASSTRSRRPGSARTGQVTAEQGHDLAGAPAESRRRPRRRLSAWPGRTRWAAAEVACR